MLIIVTFLREVIAKAIAVINFVYSLFLFSTERSTGLVLSWAASHFLDWANDGEIVTSISVYSLCFYPTGSSQRFYGISFLNS